MISTSEVGHAKNIANLNLLNTNIIALGAIYVPSNPKILLTNLQLFYTNGFNQQKPLNRELTKLRKAYKATEGVTPAQLEDLMTIIRKLKGVSKTKIKEPIDPAAAAVQYSTSQLSYDQRTNNMDLLIALLQNTPNYNPNEIEYKVATIAAKKALMLAKTQAVANTYIPLNNARSTRNKTFYNNPDNVVDLANTAKDYIFTILDADSEQYKAIARIKFKKR